MPASDLVIREEDHTRFSRVLERLRADSNAKLTFLLDRNGQQIARSGDLNGIDPTSLASLTAGNVAATDGLAKLVGEKEFSILFHEGEHDNLHISVVGGRGILVILFDERSSLGLVRLRVRKAAPELGELFGEISDRAKQGAPYEASPFSEITDEDIDALFN